MGLFIKITRRGIFSVNVISLNNHQRHCVSLTAKRNFKYFQVQAHRLCVGPIADHLPTACTTILRVDTNAGVGNRAIPGTV